MSDAGAIMDAVLVEVADAVSGVVTQRGETPWGEVRDALFAQAYQPAGSVEVLDFRQEKRTTSFLVDILTNAKTQEEMLAYLDGLQTELDGDRTLGGIVDWCWVSEWAESALLEGDEDTLGRRALVLTISTEKVV